MLLSLIYTDIIKLAGNTDFSDSEGEWRKRGSGLRICNSFLPVCSNTVGSCTKSSSWLGLAWLRADSLDWALLQYLRQVAPEGIVMHMYSKGSLSSRLCLWIFVSCLRGGDGINSHQWLSHRPEQTQKQPCKCRVQISLFTWLLLPE